MPSTILPFSPVSETPSPTTLVVGQLSSAEMASLPLPPGTQLAATVDEAVSQLASNQPQRILLCQARPGQLPPDTPARLQAACPPAELLSLAGSWCEGELRTGQPWQDVPRSYWHQPAEPIADQDNTDETFAMVSTRCYDSGSAWIDTLADLGVPAVWAQRGTAEPLTRRVSLGIWDGGQLNGQEADALAQFCQLRRAEGARVIATFDFPRADTIDIAKRLGASEVLGKPWTYAAVQQAIARTLPETPAAPAEPPASLPAAA